jgi:hypothetical protein
MLLEEGRLHVTILSALPARLQKVKVLTTQPARRVTLTRFARLTCADLFTLSG